MLEPSAYQKSNCLSSSVRNPFWLPQEKVVFHPYAKNPVLVPLSFSGDSAKNLEPQICKKISLQDVKVSEERFHSFLQDHGYQDVLSLINISAQQQTSGLASTFRNHFDDLARKESPPEVLSRAYLFLERRRLPEAFSKIEKPASDSSAALCFGLRAYIAAKAADPAFRFTPYYLRLGQWMLLEGFSIELLKEAEEALLMSNRACFFDTNGFRFVEVGKSLEDAQKTTTQLPGSEFVLPASFLVSEFLDPNRGEVSLAGSKSLARIMLLCAMYPEMISRAFVDICDVAFPITMVLPVCRFYKMLPIDFQNQLEKIKAVYQELAPIDIYPNLPPQVAQLKTHLARAFFGGISQSDYGRDSIFSPSRFSLCSIYSDSPNKERGKSQLRFYPSSEATSLLISSKQWKQILVGKSAVSIVAYLLLTIKHLLPDGHELKKQVWYLKVGDKIIELI